ncbi:MAG: HAMP domain-containing protein [Vitreoscilla sp.]|nr:HAMP domain-containing protein [Vitreoscilla sp.]
MRLPDLLRFVHDLPVGAKLALAFASVLACMAAGSAFAIHQLQRMTQLAQDATTAQALFVQSCSLIVGLAMLGMVFATGLAWAIGRSIARPLRDALRMTEAVAAGDFTCRVPAQGRDELAQLNRALLAMADRLRSLVAQVRDGMGSVGTESRRLAGGNQDLNVRTAQARVLLRQTVASVHDITHTVTRTAEAAHQASALVGQAADAAESGGALMAEVVAGMQGISESSLRMASIVGVIDAIAFQTNILALNAAVEAARAGEQGRGFAVVAGEVRSLAQRSALSAQEIRTLIQASAAQVGAGTLRVGESGERMGRIVGLVREVAVLMHGVASSAQAQRGGLDVVSRSVCELDETTLLNARLVDESAAATAALHDHAVRVNGLMAGFRLDAPPAAAS